MEIIGMEINVIGAYHSGYGHTEKVAQAVANGASKVTNTGLVAQIEN
jgi:multimeric flavodoxin WrbA